MSWWRAARGAGWCLLRPAHTFATNYLLSHPGDIVGLAALLGHTSLETTKIYVQPTHDDRAARVEGSGLNAYC